jgi:hypothetical protein
LTGYWIAVNICPVPTHTTRRNTVDTKSLFDLANEANLKFDDRDEYHDAIAVWVDGYMASPEWLMELWIDALAELKTEDTHDVLGYFGKLHKEVEVAHSERSKHTSLKMSQAAGVTVHSAFVGQRLYIPLLEFVQKYVESEVEQWWCDVCGYYSDMIESQQDDHQYQNWKERQHEG